MEDHSTTSEAQSAVCCDICGDTGVIDAIVTCTRCKVFREHLYCMRICRVDHPEDWCCEDCERRNENVSPNFGMREEFAKESVGSTCTKPQRDSTQSNKLPYNPRQNFMDQRKKIISGRTKPLSAEEVIMLASGAKACASRVKLSVRSSSVSRKNAATVYHKTPLKSTALPSKPSVQLVRANTPLVPAPSKHFKPLRRTNSPMGAVAQQQAPQSFKGLREIRLEMAKCEAGFASSPFIHGQQIVSSAGAAFDDMGLQRTRSSDCCFADPSSDASWNGSFKVSNARKHGEISYAIQAYPPSRVLRKVYEFSKLMPEVLRFELVPRGDIWMDFFQQFCLDKRDIGLYFFPRNRERWENYVILLEFMETEDLAMRARIDGMELLVFTSELLSRDCQKWKGRRFLWGVFRKKAKYASQVNAYEYRTELDNNQEDMDIDMIGGEDVVGRMDIAVPKESLQPTLPDMTIDLEIDAIGGNDIGNMDIVVSKESLLLPISNVTTVSCDEIPPGFENTFDQGIKKSCSFMDNVAQTAAIKTERLSEEKRYPSVRRKNMGTSIPKVDSSQSFSKRIPPANVKPEY